MGRTALLSVLESVSLSRLRLLYDVEPEGKAKLRLLAALKRKEGKTIQWIADDLGKPVMTIHNWMKAFDSDGLKRRHDIKRSGRPKRLSDKQLKELRKDFLKNPAKLGYSETFWSTKLVQEHVRKKFHASFVDRHITRLLHRIGFSLKKPRPADYRADKAEQARFKKNSLAWYPNT